MEARYHSKSPPGLLDILMISSDASLQITGLVAFLSTMAKSALLLAVTAAISQLKWVWYHHDSTPRNLRDLEVFDQASRGPWGAFLAVFTLRKL